MGLIDEHHEIPEDDDAEALHDVELHDGGERENLLGGTVLPAHKNIGKKLFYLKGQCHEIFDFFMNDIDPIICHRCR
jgi:hypothetical protein